jgi:RimJ/RimL family protein N-acetyltransferase
MGSGPRALQKVMISTRFLSTDEYHKFAWWLKGLNAEDRGLYFGMAVSDTYIDDLIKRIESEPTQHNFLVSYNCTGWLGVLHLARVNSTSIEFGLSVFEEYRNLGIGSDLIREGITWARNRGYQCLCLHCVRWNHAMAHLADKHGLDMHRQSGDVDVAAKLAPASWYSLNQETADVNRRIFQLWLNQTWLPFQEISG